MPDPITFRVVSDCYQQILGREPDADGLLNYCQALEKKNLTTERLRLILFRSREYRLASLRRLYRQYFINPPHPDEFNLMFHSLMEERTTIIDLEQIFQDSPESILHHPARDTVLTVCRDIFDMPPPLPMQAHFIHLFECAGSDPVVYRKRITNALRETRRQINPLFQELFGRMPSTPEVMDQIEKFTSAEDRNRSVSQLPEAQARTLSRAGEGQHTHSSRRQSNKVLVHVLTNTLGAGGFERLLSYWDRFSRATFRHFFIHPVAPGAVFPHSLVHTERLTYTTVVNLNRILELLQPDVIIDHSSLCHPEQNPGMYCGFEEKVIHFIHDCVQFRKDPEAIRKQYALSINRVISNFHPVGCSRAWRRIPTLVQPLSIDIPPDPLPERDYRSPLTVGIVGRLEPDKIPKSFLNVLRAFRSEDFRIHLYGGGHHYKNEVCHELRHNPHVTYEGVVPQDQVNRLYRSLDILMCPSPTESGGFALLEAMAWGVPVVARNTHPIPETVGPAGVLVEPDDAALIEGLLTLRDPDRLRDLSKKARQRVLRRNARLSRQFDNYYRFIESTFDAPSDADALL